MVAVAPIRCPFFDADRLALEAGSSRICPFFFFSPSPKPVFFIRSQDMAPTSHESRPFRSNAIL